MITLYLISLIAFISYLTLVLVKEGIPVSVSESYYLLGKKNKNLAILFTAFCWTVSMPLMIFWFDLLPNDLNLAVFMCCGGLLFVGTSPSFKEKYEKLIHEWSAIICFIAAYTWLLVSGYPTITIMSVLTLILVGVFLKNKVFWWEITAFISIYLTLILKFYNVSI